MSDTRIKIDLNELKRIRLKAYEENNISDDECNLWLSYIREESVRLFNQQGMLVDPITVEMGKIFNKFKEANEMTDLDMLSQKMQEINTSLSSLKPDPLKALLDDVDVLNTNIKNIPKNSMSLETTQVLKDTQNLVDGVGLKIEEMNTKLNRNHQQFTEQANYLNEKVNAAKPKMESSTLNKANSARLFTEPKKETDKLTTDSKNKPSKPSNKKGGGNGGCTIL